jgi:hypothetical protein
MSKRAFSDSDFVEDMEEDRAQPDDENVGTKAYRAQPAMENPTLIQMMHRMLDSENGNSDNDNDNNNNKNKRHKNKKHKPGRSNQNDDDDNDDDDDDDDISSFNVSGLGADAGANDEQDNVGDDDGGQKKKRFFGFVNAGFPNLATMNGEGIQEDADERAKLDALQTNCNTTDMKAREQARKTATTATKIVNKHVESHLCRVCEFSDTELFQTSPNSINSINSCNNNNNNKSVSRLIHLYDLTTCGHKPDVQLFHEITQMYNHQLIKGAGMGLVPKLFTTKEISTHFIHHNKMNLKRVLVKGINTIQSMTQVALNHVHGHACTGQNMFMERNSKVVADLLDKEISYTSKLIQADMLYRGIGVIGNEAQSGKPSRPPPKSTLGKTTLK